MYSAYQIEVADEEHRINFAGRLFMHEIGHGFGMVHVDGGPDDWDPYFPGFCAMRQSTVLPYVWYLGDDSDRLFKYDDDEYYNVYYGWQFSYNNDKQNPGGRGARIFGLDYEIIDYWDFNWDP
jgi:hypothetical protein